MEKPADAAPAVVAEAAGAAEAAAPAVVPSEAAPVASAAPAKRPLVPPASREPKRRRTGVDAASAEDGGEAEQPAPKLPLSILQSGFGFVLNSASKKEKRAAKEAAALLRAHVSPFVVGPPRLLSPGLSLLRLELPPPPLPTAQVDGGGDAAAVSAPSPPAAAGDGARVSLAAVAAALNVAPQRHAAAQRLLPAQVFCPHAEAALEAAAFQLVAAHVEATRPAEASPDAPAAAEPLARRVFRFAVSHRSRVEGAAAAGDGHTGRAAAIAAAARGAERACAAAEFTSKVDLAAPQAAIVVEALPVGAWCLEGDAPSGAWSQLRPEDTRMKRVRWVFSRLMHFGVRRRARRRRRRRAHRAPALGHAAAAGGQAAHHRRVTASERRRRNAERFRRKQHTQPLIKMSYVVVHRACRCAVTVSTIPVPPRRARARLARAPQPPLSAALRPRCLRRTRPAARRAHAPRRGPRRRRAAPP